MEDGTGKRHEEGPEIAVAEHALGKLLQLVRVVQSGMQNIDASHGLSGSQLWALWQLHEQPGMRVSELAEAQRIHASTASNLLDKLETRGWVRRERRDADNRVVRLYLTDSGQELTKTLPDPMQDRLRDALRALPARELAGLLKGMTAVLEHMSEK